MTSWDIDPNGYRSIYRALYARLAAARRRRAERRRSRAGTPPVEAAAGCRG